MITLLKRVKDTRTGHAFVLAAFGLALCDVALLVQNRSLRRQLDVVQSRDTEVPVGRTLSALKGFDLQDRFQAVASGVPLLIFTFSAGCPISEFNREGWMRLDRELRTRDRKVVWISRDTSQRTRDYFAEGAPSGVVLTEVPHRLYSQLAMRFVPHTVAVSAGGVIERVWRGRLRESALQDIGQYLDSDFRTTRVR